MDASEVAVRVRMVGGSAFRREADENAAAIEKMGDAGKKADVGGAVVGGLTSAGSKLDDFGGKLKKVGSAVSGVGRALAPVSAMFAGIGYYAVKGQMQFQKAMMLLVTQAGLPRRHIQGLTSDVLALSKAVGQNPTTLAEGLFPIVSSGVHNNARALQLLRLSGIMAAVGGDTVDNTANALTSILNTGFHPKGGASQVAAWLEATVGAGKMHLPELTESLKSSILPMVKMTGMQLPQILAAAAALTRQGVDPSTVMSRMRLSLTSVTSPTTEGINALAQMGLSKFALANDLHRPGGLLTMLEDLREHTLNKSPDQRNNLIAEIFGKSRGIGNIGALLQSLPQMQKIYGEVMHATPALLQQHFRETKTTSAFKFAQLQAEFDKEMITLGQTIQKDLLPVLIKLVPVLTHVIDWFGKLSPKTQKLIVMIAGLGVVLGPILMLLGSLFSVAGTVVSVLGILFDVLGAVVAAVGAVSLGLAALVIGIGIVVYIFRRQLWDALKAAADFIGGVFISAWHRLETRAITLWRSFTEIGKAVGQAVTWFSRLVSTIQHFIGHLGSGLLHDATSPLHKLGHLMHIPGLYTGGVIQGAGSVLVGERGPELLDLPRGATVTPLPSTALSSLTAQLGDGSGAINLTANLILDGKVLTTTVAKVNRNNQNRK